MRNKVKALVPVLVFLTGAGIFLYPAIANGIALYFQSQEIHVYENTINEATEAELEQKKQEAEEYNENLAGDPVHDPFVLNSGFVLPENYVQVLKLSEDGTMAYIEIPKISVNLPIYHGTDEEVLQKGVGHLEGSALPIGGEYRNAILCAHRGLPSAELFTRLDEMEEGDLFYLHVLGNIYAYEVDQIVTVLPEDVSEYLSPEKGKDLITLMTCTPYGLNTHRLLVRGSRTVYAEEIKEEIQDEQRTVRTFEVYAGSIIILSVLFIMIICMMVSFFKRNKK